MEMTESVIAIRAEIPRVMDTEEIASVTEETVCYYEAYGDPILHGAYLKPMRKGSMLCSDYGEIAAEKVMDGSARLWTARPDEPQRRETAWA